MGSTGIDEWDAEYRQYQAECAWNRENCRRLCGSDLMGQQTVKFTDEDVEYVGRISSTPIGPPIGVQGDWWVTVKVPAAEPYLHGHKPGELQHWTIRVDLLTLVETS